MMLLTWLGVSLGEFECFRLSVTGVPKLPVTSAAPHRSLPPQGAVTANPKSPTPRLLSVSIQTELLFPTSGKEVEELWRCPDHSAASHRSQICLGAFIW